MESASLFDRGMVFPTRRIMAIGAFLLLSTVLLFGQDNNQTISLDENGEATLTLENLEDCFTSTICIPSRAEGDDHAVWLSNNTFTGSSTDFLFESGAILEENADGTATITGTLYNTNNPTDKWQVELYLSDKKNWTDWSALGRSYKDERNFAGTSYQDWSYYIMDLSQDSKLIGLADNAGKTLVLKHAPASYLYGFQVGQAANSKNANFGLSGWFSYSWDGVNYHQGDFNLDLDCSDREVTFEAEETEFDCDDLGENTVSVTATDQYGNTCTQEIIVTVQDITPPTVVTKNINVGLNSMGTVTIAPEDVIQFNCNGGGGGVSVPEPVPGAGSAIEFFASNCTSDNCGIATYTVSKTTFDCNDAGQNIVTVTVTDQSGNVTTETAVVNVIDATKPEVKAKNITVELDENGIATITPEDMNDGSYDSCGSINLTLSKTTFNCEEIGNNVVTLIGTDGNGNTETDNAIVTVVDNSAPVVVTQDITINLDMYGQAIIEPKDLLVICDDAVIEENNGGGNGGGGGFVPGAGNTATAFDTFSDEPTCTKDNCKITSIMASIEQFDCSHIGTNVVTITVTDGQGNSTTATANVTVVDPIGPTAIAQDITVDLNANGQASIDADDIDNGSSDNCSFTKSIDVTDFDCDDVGNNQVVTLTVTDAAGNTAIATANVTVRDLIAPTAIAQDVTVSLDANGQASIDVDDINNGSSDNCSFTTSISKTDFDCNDVGDNTVILTVTDAAGNSSTANATVTVTETILPVIVPLNITVDLDENGQATVASNEVYTSITDNCEVTSIVVDPMEFDCDDLGENTVTITATDANGNVATATATVTVRDITPPTVVTKNINVGLNSMGTVTIAPEDVIQFNCNGGGGGVSVPEPVPGAGSAVEFFASNCTSDNCGIATYTVSKTTFDCNDAGQNIVTVTVTDQSGNVTTETAVVNVIDATKPEVKAKNITVELDENGIATITPEDMNDGSYDSCGSINLTLSKTTFNCEEIGNNVVTLIGTDGNGNTETDNAIVTVVDNSAPVVVTQDITINLDMYGQAIIEPKDLLVICDDAVIEENNGGGNGGGGGFVPGAGNTATAFDTFSAEPTCTKDNCKITSIMASIEQFDCSHIGTNVVTITVTDGQGNSTTATANVTVVDPIGPTAIAQDITVDLNANGQASIDADDIDNGSSDNCSFTKSIDVTDFDCDDVGNNQVVTLTVTDAAGNTAIATANVTVRDLIAPTAIAQDVTVSLDANGQASIDVDDINNGSSDNCSFTTSISKTDFDCNDVGDNTVILTVTDAAGNSSTANATVTVTETILPVIVPLNITVDLDENGQATVASNEVYTSITDNCEVTSIVVDPMEFDCDDLGENTVTITATDANGNVATATATVTVRDITPPTVVTKNINVGLNSMGTVTIAPEDVIQFNCNGGGGGVSVPEPVPGAGSAVEFFASNCTSDNCGIATYTVSKTTFDCNDAGQNIVTVTVTDQSGNVTTETAVVNVIDATKPEVKAKNITVELDENGIATITPEDMNDGSYDSCGSINLTLSKTTFNCEEIGNNVVTLIGTDGNGNTETDNAIVTVVDNSAPVVVTQDITINLDMYGQAIIEPKDLLVICDDAVIEENNGGGNGGGGGFVPGAGNTATAFDTFSAEPTCTKDNCKITSIMASIEQFDCSHIGTNVVTITVTDGQGNSTTATANVTVVDPIGPTAIAQDITVDLNANGQASIDADDIDNGSSDNCSFTKSIDVTDFDCDDVGNNQVVTLTVTDAAGNTAIATANVTVRDLIAPTAIAQDVTVSLDANGQASIDVDDINNGSSDNCSFTTSISKTDFDCNDVGDNTVILTVTDAAGNSSTANATVTVTETILPVIVPLNITVDLDENGQATVASNEVYTSITDNCEVTSIVVDPMEFDCDDLGENTVTITATDANGNVATATATVTVRDITPPTVVTKNINVGLNSMGTVTIAPEDVIQFNCNGGGGGVSVPEPVPGAGSAVEFFASNCTSDNCGIATYTVSKTTFDCNDAGQNIVTVTVTDQSGNVTTETAVVNVIDATKPEVKAKNITVELDENGIATITPEDMNDGSYDSCGSINLTLSKTTFNCEEIGNNVVTLIGTDGNGNTETDNAIVTVVDNSAPVVVTQDITINLDMYGQAIIEPKDLLVICDDAVIEENNGGGNGGGGGFVPGAGNTATAFDTFSAEPTCTKDNCKITSIMASIEQFDCSHIGTNVVTITVTDGQGNSTTATANVTVVDPIGPTAIAQDITVDLNANGQASIDADDIDNGSSDNCSFTKSIDVTDFDCDDVGNNQVVTLTVTDAAGNTAIATANVTVRDLIAPTAIAQDVTVSLDANGQASIDVDDINNGSSDNCSFTTSISKTDFDCNDVGDNTVILTVTDAAGNSSTANATVTVTETILPVIVPLNITVDLDENGQATVASNEVYTSITDNCEVTSIVVDPMEFDCDDLGENTVTITATDANGNVATATATVTVRDITPPTVVTKNINVGLNSMGTVTIAPEDVIQFNCNGGGGGVSVPEPVPGAGSAVEFFASNCTSDNCGIATYTVSKTTFDCNDAGQNIVTVTVTDQSGNVTTETAVVNVIDATKPEVKAKNITVELDENGIATITPEDMNDGSYDSCGSINLTLSKTTFNCEEIGNNVVTLIGTDGNGNTETDNAIVTVVDNSAPVVVTQDITINLDMYGQAIIEPKDLLVICDDAVIEENNGGGNGGGGGFVPGAGNTATAFDTFSAEPTCTKDNCKITSIMASIEQFDCSHIGTNVVTITVTDGQGNSTTATANVTVVDPIGPTAIAQDITVDLNANGQASIDADDIDNGSSDNCSFTKSIDVTDFDCDDVGNNQVVTLTVTDAAGNTAIATANVTVRDLIAPTAIAQDVTVSLDANGQASIDVDDINNGSSDNCSFTTSISKTDFDCNDVGDNTVILTVTDAAGNSSTANATVTVTETILPVIVPLNITVDLDENGQATVASNEVYTSITDNCEVTSIVVDPMEFDCDDLGENTVTITATDANGNVATATATVTVRDITPPTVVTKNINVGLNSMGTVTIAPEDVIQFNCNGGGGGVSVPEPVPGAGSAVEFFASNCTSDNCGIATYTVSKTTFDCNDAGQNIVTVTVTDQSGNVTTETAVVNVIDATKPEVKAKNITVELDENGIATITPEDMNDGSYDSCGSINLTLSKTTFNCEEIGNNVVTLIGTDGNGNTETDNAIVTVVDNSAPVVVTQDITINLDMYGQAIIEPKDLLVICDDAVIEENNGGGNGGGGGFVPGAGNTATAFDTFSAEPTCTKDNCKITSIMASIEQFDCSHIGTNVVTITVTDGQGNSTTATANVTVVDPIGPTAIAQDITVDLNANGQASIDADDIDNGSSDNCSFTKSIDVTDFDCDDVGNNQVVTLTVTDAAGNTAIATANVTVRDLIAPTAIAQDVTVSLDANGQASIDVDDINNGSSDNCSFTTSISKTDFDCNDVGDNTVILTVTDAAGNSSTANATVTVTDIIAPTAIVQDITIQLDANGQASITAAQIDNGSSDNCGIDTITIDTPDFDCTNLGPNTVTMTVTDVNGLSSTTTATVTVQDQIAPVIVPQNITVDLDANGQVTISENQVYSSITDNCSVTEIFVGPLNFDCSNIGDNTVTIQAADAGGNITSSTAIVTVRDVTAPTVVTQNITVNLDAFGNASITTAQIDNGSYDNCDLTLSLDTLNFDCSDLGANTVTLTGTDASGNTASATATVTVVDNTAPVITTQNISVSLDANGNAVITESQVATATDNCGTTDITVSQTNFDCTHVGDNVITVTATDANGNQSTASVTVTIADTIAPTVIAQDVSINLDNSGNASITVAQIDNGSSDNCDLTLTLDQLDFDCTNVGENTVTLTGTDTSGNTASATAIVTVIDNNAVTITPSDITVSLDENGMASIDAEDLLGEVTTECTVARYGNNNSHAVWLSKYTASNQNTDFHFDSNGGTLTQNPDGTATVTGTIVNKNDANDSWTVQLNLADKRDWDAWSALGRSWKGRASNVGTNYLNWDYYEMDTNPSRPSTLTGLGSNAGKVKTLAHRPANLRYGFQVGQAANDKDTDLGMSGWFTYQNDQGNYVQGDFNLDITNCTTTVGSDSCGEATIEISQTDFDCTDTGENTVTITATTANNVVTTETVTVTIVDDLAPTVLAQDITVNLDSNGNASITTGQIDNGSSDNCDLTLSLDKLNFNCSDIGANTVTLTGTDTSGNTATANATVTVVDNTAPTVITQDVTVNLDASGNASVTVAQIDNGSSDNCDLTLSLDQLNFDCSDLGANTVTLTGTDASGNSASATATVTVIDNTAPVITTQNIMVDLNANGQANITESQVISSVTDNCAITETVVTQTSFDCSDIGDNTVTVQAADAAGNITTTSVIVTVRDNTAPTVITQDVTVNLDANGNASVTVAQIDNGSSDNCDLTLSLDQLNFDCSDLGANTVTLTGTDASGNSASATATVTVIDNTAPVITTQNITVDLNANGQANITESQVIASVTDNCAITETVVTQTSFDCSDIGDNTVTVQAADAAGNITTTSVIVTVRDNTAPTVITQDVTVNLDANGNASVTVAQIDNGSSDNCDLTLSLDQLNFDCSHVGENTVTLTGTDASGNTSSATAIVTIVDNNAPVINAQDVTLQLDANGEAKLNPADIITNNTYEECEVTAYEGNSNHSVALRHYFPNNSNFIDFVFDSNGGKLTQFSDGTATVRGTIVNPQDNNDQWEVVLNLIDRKDWNAWSAMGRSWKGNANTVGDSYKDWSYYIMDTNPSNPSTLTGLGSNAGKSTAITHMPSNYNFGFQVGQAANDKNGNYGMSGWFFYTNYNGDLVQGDFNMDITTCTTFVDEGACGDAELTIDQVDFDCSDLGQNTVTITLTDAHNNSSTETITVTIEDNTAPTVITQDVTVSLDASGNASVTTAQINNGSYDNCDLTLSLDQLNFDCSDLGANTVTLTGTDASGNTASATATVTVVDNTAPVAAAQNITVQLDAIGQASISASQINNGSTDNCGISSVVINTSTFDCSDLGENTVTLTVTDTQGNTSSKTATVTVIDNVLPVITNMPANIVYNEQDANCGESIHWNVPAATDNCQVNLVASHNPGDVFPVGTTTVTYTATDNAGNSATASFDITVVAAPVSAALNVTQQLTCSEDEIGAIAAIADGGCGDYSYLWSNGATTASISNLGAGTYTVTVSDPNGGSATASVELESSTSLEVTGTVSPEYPVANGGAQNTIYLGYGEQTVTLTADVTGGVGPYTYEWFPENAIACTSDNSAVVAPQESTTYTVIVTDANGCTATETFDIEVVDVRCEDTSHRSYSNSYSSSTTYYGGNYNGYYGRDHYNGRHDDCRHDDGGSVGTGDDNDCQCEGRMRNFTFVYNGVSGVTIKVYNKRYTVLIDKLEDVQNGDVITVNGYDRHGRLDSKTHLRIGSSFYEIHTSCSINILGETYGPFTITGYTDGEGSSCTLEEDDDDETNQSCDARAAEGGGHALWLSDYGNYHSDAQFFFEDNSGSFTKLEGGKAKVTGIVSNRRNSNDKWQIEFYLSDAMTWSEWSALGRSYKDEAGLAGNKYRDWTYYIMDQSKETRLVGLGHNTGYVKKLYHMPSNFHYGFQVGEAANNKNSNYGISGWFWYKNNRGHWVQGDINMDLDNCDASNDDCDTGVTPYDGDVRICLNGYTYCVDQDDVDYYLRYGATLGSCGSTQTSLSVGGAASNNLADDADELTKNTEINISAYPNPTKSVANITFKVSEAGPVSVGIYSTKGLLISTLYKGMAEADTEYKVTFDGSDVTEGIYMIRVRTAGYLETKKLMIKK